MAQALKTKLSLKSQIGAQMRKLQMRFQEHKKCHVLRFTTEVSASAHCKQMFKQKQTTERAGRTLTATHCGLGLEIPNKT